jgi:hypothetical protein
MENVSESTLIERYRDKYPGLKFYKSKLSIFDDIKIEYCTTTSKLILTRNDNLVREIQMYIWLPEPTKPDYWFRYRVINDNIIILQDYYGIRLFNLDLDILFDLPVPEIYKDVYGCEVNLEKREVSVWLMNETKQLASELTKQDPEYSIKPNVLSKYVKIYKF